jgi:tripartite-type tricarboxylate transporter receptor subunit TctC
MSITRRSFLAIATAGLGSAALPTFGQSPSSDAAYPNRRVRIVVGFAAGGGTDVMARFFAQRFTDALGQPFIVENKVGAGGNAAIVEVAKSPSDGYSLLMVGTNLLINVGLFKPVPYDPIKDLAPVSVVASAPDVFTAATNSGIRSLRELVAQAKEKPAQIAYGSAGIGTGQHLSMELFCSMAGINMIHVPFNGGGPSIAAALGGQVPVLTSSLPTALSHIRAGKLVPLAVTGGKRSSLAPDIPTVSEASNVVGYDMSGWYGLLAPAGTPQHVLNMLNAQVDRVLKEPEALQKYAGWGFEPYRESPEAFGSRLATELPKWVKVVKMSGATAN